MQTKTNCHQDQRFEVADIFRLYGDKYRSQNRLSKEQLKVMSHIANCRTAAMGGHTKICSECGFQQNFYNSKQGSALSQMSDHGQRKMVK